MTSQIRVDEITNRSGLGTVTIYDNGFEFTGVTTFTENVDITGGLTIGGVLTYEDVTNIDSVGVVTARNGLHVTSGNVAIGHNDPLNTLHVKGPTGGVSARFTDAVNATVFVSHPSSGKSKIADAGGNYGFEFDTASVNILSGGSERVRIDDVGRLLIGRTSQLQSSAERLTIDSGMAVFRRSSTNAAAVYIRNEDSTADTRHPYLIFTDGSGNRGGFGIQNDSSSLWISGQNGIAFRTSGSAPSQEERLRIASDGDIEYKYNDADTDAEIGSTQLPHGLRIYNTNNTLGRLAGIHFSHGSAGTANAGIFHETTNTSSGSTTCLGDLVFYTKNSGVSYMTEKLRITNDGKFGFNTTNPGAFDSGANNLVLLGNTSGTGNAGMTIASGTGSYGNIYFADGTNGADAYRGHIAYNHNGNTMRFATNGSERLRIDSAGNMGLGTNNPNDQTSSGYTSFTVNDSSGGIIDLRRGDIALSGGRLVGLQHEFGLESRSQNSSSQISFYVNNAYAGRFTNNGLCFGNDTAANNALDDYEEGTWTPTCASASSVSYSNQYGRYTKVGNCITIWWDLIWTSLSGGNSARIGGLPYSPVVNTNQAGYGVPVFRDASGTNSENRIYGNSSYFGTNGILLQHYNSSGNPTAGSFAGSGRITGWAQYFDNNAY